MTAKKPLRGMAWAFALSGTAGLLLQSTWAWVAGWLLGQEAVAHAWVLGTFMAGLALGAWAGGLWAARARRPLRAYALAETVAAAMAWALWPAALWADAVLDAHPQWAWAAVVAWVLPASAVLGAGLPLLVAALRRHDRHRMTSSLYASNAAGAALGAALTGPLLAHAGVAGALGVAGGLSAGVAAWAWWVARGIDEPTLVASPTHEPSEHLPRGTLWAAAWTGAAVLVLEPTWMRMLVQTVGASAAAYQTVVAVVVAGLALGGAWETRRPGRDLTQHAWTLAWVTGGTWLLWTPAFSVIAWAVRTLPKTTVGYVGFEAIGVALATAWALPTAVASGRFLARLLNGRSAQDAGRLLAANTIGAVLGVMAAMVTMPWLGLQGLVLGAMALSLGAVQALVGVRVDRRSWAVAFTVLLVVTVGREPQALMASGAFGTGRTALEDGAKVPFVRHGRTATVTVTEWDGAEASIATNGKPDAGLRLSLSEAPTPDEPTMVLLGALGLTAHDAPRRVAVVGWGSGLTTHTVLGDARVQRVDTFELEPAMVEGSRLFGERVDRAFHDPRSRWEAVDARRALSDPARPAYDLIVSEPSNPWVGGVAGLFTRSFHHRLRERLAPEGVAVVWLHAYGMDDRVLASLVKAMLAEFPGTELYEPSPGDLILVARRDGAPVDVRLDRLKGKALRSELARVGVTDQATLRAHRKAGPDALLRYAQQQHALPYDDDRPWVAFEAPRTRFMHARPTRFLTMLQEEAGR